MNRTCKNCGHDFEESEANFKRLKTGNLGHVCIGCRRKKQAEVEHRKHEKRRAGLDRLEVAGIDRLITAASNGGSAVPHTAELLERIMEYFGGVSGFAGLFVKQYYESQAGGAFRTKMLDTVSRLISKNAEMGGAKKPLTLWSEEELENELNQRLQQAVLVYAGGFIDGKVEQIGLSAPQTDPSQGSISELAAAAALCLENGRVPAGGTEGIAGGTSEPAHRSAENVRPDAGTAGIP